MSALLRILVIPFTFCLFAAPLSLMPDLAIRPLPAQPKIYLPFKKHVDADRDKTYPLTEKNGPWLIVCATFGGQDGFRQANNLVYELRKQHKLNAYVYRKRFDHSEKLKGNSWSPTETEINEKGERVPKKLNYKPLTPGKFEEIAVVVGDFAEMNDAAIQNTKDKIKKLKPKTLEVSDAVESSQLWASAREAHRKRASDKAIRAMGPMRQAFVITNPLIPESYFRRNTVGQNIINLNKDLTYSLLKNPKKYSVRVATFRGESTFTNDKNLKEQKKRFSLPKFKTKKETTKLAIASAKAHRLTKELRKSGVEAYEFHDRYESYVCVGSYDWIKTTGRDGRVELNQDIVNVINEYKPDVVNFGSLNGAIQPKSIPKLRSLGIAFDVQPLPVLVPKYR